MKTKLKLLNLSLGVGQLFLVFALIPLVVSLVAPCDVYAAGCRHAERSLNAANDANSLEFARHRRWQYIAGEMILVFELSPQWDPASAPCDGPQCRSDSGKSFSIASTVPATRVQLVASQSRAAVNQADAGTRNACCLSMEISPPFFDALLRPPSIIG